MQASGFADVQALFDEIHIADGPSAFYVTDANVRVMQIDAALLLKSRENQLIELLHELAHAKRHRLKCGFHGQHYRDDSSLNERTVERFAALKAAAWINRFPAPFNDAEQLDYASGTNAAALNMRFDFGVAPANRVVLRQWFREGAATPWGAKR
ncbi:ImmA/IrrE family metallo-endopeptidase [Trinickia sp. LjRoot230]|uniref:hypothetical protein n=1 Tax=Trinickia sp. LjRoot230 TaxID=3342288 RepID=UPI003ECD81CA